MDCEHCQNLISEILSHDLDVPEKIRRAFFDHVVGCWACREQYEEVREVVELLRSYGKISPDTVELLESHDGYEVPDHKRLYPRANNEIEITDEMVEASLQRMLAKLDASESLHKRQQESWDEATLEHTANANKTVLVKSGTYSFRHCWYVATGLAMAACLLIVASMWFDAFSGEPAAQPVSVTYHVNGQIELITTADKEYLPLGEPIKNSQGTMELLLGRTHKVVLNSNTTVTITTKSIVNSSHVAWNINLDDGELYAEVVPNLPGGTRFAVTTPNALATITGTKFNIKVDQESTELTLLEGSVRFKSFGASGGGQDTYSVNVTTGHVSTITGHDNPTLPSPINAAQRVAWVNTNKSMLALQSNNTSAQIIDLNLDSDDALYLPKSLDIERINYETWRDENQSWFQSQFPWAFDWQKQLSKQNIKADYLDVLVTSGDIWQFNSQNIKPQLSQASASRLMQFYPNTNIQIPQLISVSTDPLQHINDQFLQWQHTLESNDFDDVSLQLLTASAYLAKTQLGAALWAREYPEKTNMLHQLQQVEELWPSDVVFIQSDDLAQTMVARAEQCQQLRRLAQQLLTRTDDGKAICTLPESVEFRKNFVEHLQTLNTLVSKAREAQ